MSDRRYFLCDDNGHVKHWIVAEDMRAAMGMLRGYGVTFGRDESPNPEAPGVIWREMTTGEVALVNRCHTDDDRGTIKLADANIGDWFSSEW